MADIVRAAIHPAIGIARVGNSPDGFFTGPELPWPVDAPDGGYKDPAGALKRQAARFRVYGLDARGAVVRELTADTADISWTVHVANRKAAWYNFDIALDIPEATPSARRNAAVAGIDREKLVIDPGPRTIGGRMMRGEDFRLLGNFLGMPVSLGELRTDADGRLLFLGGHGVSATPYEGNTLYTYGNNDGWHDDTSDGPVSATVRVNGRTIPCDPAWVVTAPPNYAPDILPICSLYDVIYDACRHLWYGPVTRVSFTTHILPILEAFVNLQWVNYGFHVQFGWHGPNEFTRGDFIAKLANPASRYAEVRRQVFNMFRHPDYTTFDLNAWPQMYGDGTIITGDIANDNDAREYLALTATQTTYLQQWAAGEFDGDYDPSTVRPQHIEQVALEDQPATLDRAALRFCLGGAFHPGCELTWPIRHYTMFGNPLRIRPRAPDRKEQDYGDVLTPAVAMSEYGPLYASGPGDLTRWMAVPWQADTASCRAGYESAWDPYLPTFWPARVPNHVLTEASYRTVMDPSRPLSERLNAFETRATWYRVLKGPGALAQVNQMAQDFGKLGVVERRQGPGDTPELPRIMYVETTPGTGADAPHDRNTLVSRTLRAPSSRRQLPPE